MSSRTALFAVLTALAASSVFAQEEGPQAEQQDATRPAAVEQAQPAATPEADAPAAKAAAEMTPEQAAAAAVDGTIEFASEKIDMEKATAAEISAYNATAAPEDKIVCKREKVTGTNRSLRVCATVAQRRAMYQKTQNDMESVDLDSAGTRMIGKLPGQPGR